MKVAWGGAELADAIGSIWGAAGLVILAAVVIVVVLPVLGLAIELVLILLFGLVGKLAFGRPWIVEAAPVGAGRGHEERERVSREVRGWRASGEAIAQMRGEI